MTITIQERLELSRHITEDGHWIWTGVLFTNGYGGVCIDGRMVRVHRLAYRIYKNVELDNDILVLHKPPCIRRDCFNPDHLYTGTHLDNITDCINAGNHHEASKTQCIRGHEFTPENTLLRKDKPGRECRACRKEAKKKYDAGRLDRVLQNQKEFV